MTFPSLGKSSTFDRTTSNYLDAKEKVRKIRELISTGKYDADIARYIPRVLEMRFQGMLEDTDTREKVVHASYKDIEELDFQILLTDKYYLNLNSIHLCFPMKISKSTSESSDIDSDMITVNNFLVHLIKEITVTKYWRNKELIPIFSAYEMLLC